MRPLSLAFLDARLEREFHEAWSQDQASGTSERMALYMLLVQVGRGWRAAGAAGAARVAGVRGGVERMRAGCASVRSWL